MVAMYFWVVGWARPLELQRATADNTAALIFTRREHPQCHGSWGSRAVGHNVPNKRLNINFIINEHLRVGHTEGKLARHTIAMSRWMGNSCSVNVTGAVRKTSRLKSPRIYRPPYQTPTPPSSILCLELNMYPHSISMAIYTNSTRYVYITKCSILQVRRY